MGVNNEGSLQVIDIDRGDNGKLTYSTNVILYGTCLPVALVEFVFHSCARWCFVGIPLTFSCPADHVPDWQPRILLGMVEARSINLKNTTTLDGTIIDSRIIPVTTVVMLGYDWL